MLTTNKYVASGFTSGMLLVLATAACTRPAEPNVKRIKSGEQYAGFLKDYSKLAANPDLDDDLVVHELKRNFRLGLWGGLGKHSGRNQQ